MNTKAEKPTGLALMRAEFPEHQISKMCRSTKKDNAKGSCPKCKGFHGLPAIQLDYVGHAALTDRLLDADPQWTWEPLSIGNDGYPVIDQNGGMWIKLTVCGVTRLGYGDAQGKIGGDAMKERIGDALRNAAMRFGAALDLWHKGSLHVAYEDTEPPSTHQPAAAKSVSKDIWESLPIDEQTFLSDIANEVSRILDVSGAAAAMSHIEMQKLDADEKVALWSRFDSKQRAAFKSADKQA